MRHPLNWLLRPGRGDDDRLAIVHVLGDAEQPLAVREVDSLHVAGLASEAQERVAEVGVLARGEEEWMVGHHARSLDPRSRSSDRRLTTLTASSAAITAQ